MRERFHHLGLVESFQSTQDKDFSRWADIRLDRWLVDWCLRTGKDNAAKCIAREKPIEARRVALCHWMLFSPIFTQTLVDLDLFADIRRIEDALSNHSCTEALAWCSENKTALRKIKAWFEVLFTVNHINRAIIFPSEYFGI